MNIINVNMFGPRSGRPNVLLGLIWIQTVCKDHHQTTQVKS